MGRFDDLYRYEYTGALNYHGYSREDIIIMELCNLSDRLDLLMDMDKEGYYINIRNLLNAQNSTTKAVEKITRIPDDDDHYRSLNNLWHKLDDIEDSLTSQVAKICGQTDQGKYISLRQISERLDSMRTQIDDIQKTIKVQFDEFEGLDEYGEYTSLPDVARKLYEIEQILKNMKEDSDK